MDGIRAAQWEWAGYIMLENHMEYCVESHQAVMLGNYYHYPYNEPNTFPRPIPLAE